MNLNGDRGKLEMMVILADCGKSQKYITPKFPMYAPTIIDVRLYGV